MKTMATLLIVMIITSTIQSIKMSEYKRTNETLKSMVDEVAEYADSTMDTGEFDEFCQSPGEALSEKDFFPYCMIVFYNELWQFLLFQNLHISQLLNRPFLQWEHR